MKKIFKTKNKLTFPISIILTFILLFSTFSNTYAYSPSSQYTRLYSMSHFVDIHNSEKDLIQEYKDDYFLPYLPHIVIDKDYAPTFLKSGPDNSLSAQFSVYNTSYKTVKSIQFTFYYLDKYFNTIVDSNNSYLISNMWEHDFEPFKSYTLHADFFGVPNCSIIYVDQAVLTFDDGSKTIAKCDMWLFDKDKLNY